ncbi:MAG: acetyl-CoA carboxylase biotin carboxyl carrier protein [Tepidisphaeraceae bacterium]
MKEKKKTNTAAADSPAKSRGPMDTGLLQELVKLMAANDLNTLALRDGDRRVVLKRGAVAPVMVAGQMPPMQMSAVAPAAPTPARKPEDDISGLKEIKSPMVGTFYSKPSPDSKSFVQVGSQVNEDTDVCLIEAMKVFNNIKAECRGTIARVCVQDGQPVEYGTVLFLVKP